MNRPFRTRTAALVLWFTLLPFQAVQMVGVPPGLLAFASVALLTAGSAHAAQDWPEMPLPPKADAQWIAQSMRVSGIPTRVLQFQSRASRSEVAEYYRAYWTGGYPQTPSVRLIDDSTVVGQKHGPYLMTVTVRDAEHDGSQGVIAIAQVEGSTVDREPGDLPMLPNAQVVRVIESDDPGLRSRELMVITPQTPEVVLQFYQASFENAGWQQIQLNETPRTARGGAGSFVVFARGNVQMQMSIQPAKDRRTWVIANRVTKDTGP